MLLHYVILKDVREDVFHLYASLLYDVRMYL